MRILFSSLCFLLLQHAQQAWGGVEQLPEVEFRKLAGEMAGKVNLFRAIWTEDPEAEFYGGTSRDFLYWLKGQFKDAKDPAQAQAIAEKLRNTGTVDVQSFILGDSDIDVISSQRLSVDPLNFGVRKMDAQPTELFQAQSVAGNNEIHQGYAPAEKIRLGKSGIVDFPPLGDGAHEVYSGRLTVHFAAPEEFAKTKYAQQGLNHPSLLALRYLRLLAINYFRTYGRDYPDMKKLLATLDPDSAAKVKEILTHARESGELTPYLNSGRFLAWANGSIQKAFRSYTNPTAALKLMEHFGVDALVQRYANRLEPINQYVFAKFRDPALVAENFKKERVQAGDFYLSPKDAFPDGFLYHGTGDQGVFRNIIFQGVLPSEKGTAGGGLYGVALGNIKFAEEWKKTKELTLKFPVREGAKIVDITKGVGAKLWEKYKAAGKTLDEFADAFGIDILLYPYGTEAFVVKNSSALGGASGVYRKILPLDELVETAKSISDPQSLVELIKLNRLRTDEIPDVVKNASISAEDMGKFALKTHAADAHIIIPVMDVTNPLHYQAFQKWIPWKFTGATIYNHLQSKPGTEAEKLLMQLFEVTYNNEVRRQLYLRFAKNPYWRNIFSDPNNPYLTNSVKHGWWSTNLAPYSGGNPITANIPFALYKLEKMLESPEQITDAKVLTDILDYLEIDRTRWNEIYQKTKVSAENVWQFIEENLPPVEGSSKDDFGRSHTNIDVKFPFLFSMAQGEDRKKLLTLFFDRNTALSLEGYINRWSQGSRSIKKGSDLAWEITWMILQECLRRNKYSDWNQSRIRGFHFGMKEWAIQMMSRNDFWTLHVDKTKELLENNAEAKELFLKFELERFPERWQNHPEILALFGAGTQQSIAGKKNAPAPKEMTLQECLDFFTKQGN